MRNIFISLFFSIISCQFLFSQEPLNQNEIKTFKEDVMTLDNNTKTIVCDFIQYKHLSFLNNDIETMGKLVFKIPNFVKWEYTSPYQYTVVFKDDELLIMMKAIKATSILGLIKCLKA